MKLRNYMKKNLKERDALSDLERQTSLGYKNRQYGKITRNLFIGLIALGALVTVLVLPKEEFEVVSLGEESSVKLASAPMAAMSAKRGTIRIPKGVVKANPFVPYRDLSGMTNSDVAGFELIEPPESLNGTSEAARVMDTVVSGILFDKYSPSAILNIEGNDYLVKKGDVINSYKVLAIAQDSVTVQLGNNTYKAGIGELLVGGTLNENVVPNLNNKFGGVKDELQ